MKTATIDEVGGTLEPVLDWLQQGETILLLKKDGRPLGRFVPESSPSPMSEAERRELYARRFAPLDSLPQRDLSDIVSENRGDL